MFWFISFKASYLGRESEYIYFNKGKQQTVKISENHVEENVYSSLDSMQGTSDRIFDVFKLLQIFEIWWQAGLLIFA
jgi:hypothetical protein